MKVRRNKTVATALVLICTAIISCGCTTNPRHQPTIIEGDPGTITIFRDRAKPGIVPVRVSIDGERVGSLENQEVLEIPVRPGRRILKIHFNPILFMDSTTIPVDISPGSDKHYLVKSEFRILKFTLEYSESEWAFFLVPSGPSAAEFCCDSVEVRPEYIEAFEAAK